MLIGCDPDAGKTDDGKKATSESSNIICGNGEEDDTNKDTNVKCKPDSTNITNMRNISFVFLLLLFFCKI